MPDDVHLSTVSAELSSLLQLAADGDERAFASLYDATAPRVFGLAFRMLRDWAWAEEVAHEVFLEIWRHAERFDDERGTAIAWMMAIAHRQAAIRMRSARASTTREETGTQQDLPITHTSLEATQANEAFLQLSPNQRECLEMAYLGGHTYDKVAGLLVVEPGTVKSRIRAALLRLQELM